MLHLQITIPQQVPSARWKKNDLYNELRRCCVEQLCIGREADAAHHEAGGAAASCLWAMEHVLQKGPGVKC